MTAQPQDHKKSPADFPKTVTLSTPHGDITLPHFAHIPGGALRKARKQDDQLDQFYTLLETALGEDSDELAFIDSLTITEQGELFQQWTQGAQVGESSGS